MTKILVLLFFCIAASYCKAQSMYSFTFSLQESNPIRALLMVQPNGNCMVRYRFADNIVDQQLGEATENPLSPEAIEDSLLYAWKSGSIITGKDSLPPIDLWMKLEGNVLIPASITISTANGKKEKPLQLVQFIEYSTLTRSFLQDYFLPTEPIFVQLFSNNTRALSPLEKNTRIHLLIVANTADSTIGTSTLKDMNNAEDFFSTLTEVMGIKTMNSIKVFGNKYSKTQVLAEIQKLSPQPNDIVVFYYTGHGFRTANKRSPYPMYDLRSNPKQDYLKESLTTDTIVQLLKVKNARMSLILSDCCNWDPNIPLPYVQADPQTRSTNIPWDVEKCRALFLNPTKTNIIGIAADPNQLAVSNVAQGSFFFKYFKESVSTVISKTYHSFSMFQDWAYIAESTKMLTFKKSKKTYCSKPYVPQNICNQSPRFFIQ